MKNKRLLIALAVCCVAIGAFAYSRYVRPRKHAYAALLVSTPTQKEAATCGIVPQRHTLGPGLNLSINMTNMTFGDGDNELSVKWKYRGGISDRDFYRFEMTFCGKVIAKSVSLSDSPVTLLSQGGYTLTLNPNRKDLYSQVP